MKDVHVVGSKMTRNDGKMAKLIGCAFHFETEFFLAAYPASNDFIFVFARETMKKKSQIKRPIFLPNLTSQSLREVSFYYRVGHLGHWRWFHHHLKGNLA